MPNLRGKTWTESTPANVEDAQYWEDHLISQDGAHKTIGALTLVDSQGTELGTFDGSENVEIEVGSGSGGSGHTIQDSDGTEMAQEPVLQFLNAEVSEGEGKTIVDCQGEKGDAATIEVGTVTTLPAGSDATVTNSGTSSEAVFDFAIPQGANGQDGADGQDGFSPSASVTKVGSVATISITDKTGTTTAQIHDGTGSGDMTKSVYDTNDNGIVDSAETLNGLTASVTELNYMDGVTSAVQTQLNGKVSTETGKGLSSNDYTTTEKNKLSGIEAGAEVNAINSADSNFSISNRELSLSSSVTSKLSNFNTDGSIASGSKLDDAITAKSKVVANPTLAGTEDAITGIEIDNVKYKIEGGGGVSGYVLVITTNSELNGQMLTATKGSKTKRGLVANNQCRISLDEGGVWTIEEPINHHTVNTENLVYYGEYQCKLKSYTIYGFHVDDSKSNPNPSTIHENDMVSYHVQYGGENVDNYNYDYGYMDFANDEWRNGSWSDDEFFMPRPVLLKQDFSDKIYLNPYDLTRDVNGNSVNDKLTGSTDGYNAMMEFGRNGLRIWYKVVPDATPTSYTVYVSDIQLDNGFHAWSFYDCNDELMEHFYMAIYNGSNVSSVLRSLSGKSILNNVAGTTEISYAKANNKNSETYSWYIDVYADRVLINFLMMLVIRSANSDRIGYGNYTGGSSASNLLQTGLGNTKGFFYGKQANGVVKVFGIENWFANQWRRCAGYSLVNGVIKYKLTYGTADGSSSSGYIESTSAPTNYLSGNSIATNLSNSAIVKETAKTDGSLLPSAFGGSTSTNYCDSAWSATGTTFALVGGTCAGSAACGAFCVSLADALSIANWAVGAALSCKPPIR